jgi:hypothetical protein
MTAAAPALCSDGRRSAIATAVAVVVPLAVGLATIPGDPDEHLRRLPVLRRRVATTFGATDVNITSRMRRIVNAHTLLTFVDNSVIVALLASFLTH